MKRREFIAVLVGAALAGPRTVRAQQPSMPVVGFLGGESPDTDAYRVRALRQGLTFSRLSPSRAAPSRGLASRDERWSC